MMILKDEQIGCRSSSEMPLPVSLVLHITLTSIKRVGIVENRGKFLIQLLFKLFFERRVILISVEKSCGNKRTSLSYSLHLRNICVQTLRKLFTFKW